MEGSGLWNSNHSIASIQTSVKLHNFIETYVHIRITACYTLCHTSVFDKNSTEMHACKLSHHAVFKKFSLPVAKFSSYSKFHCNKNNVDKSDC